MQESVSYPVLKDYNSSLAGFLYYESTSRTSLPCNDRSGKQKSVQLHAVLTLGGKHRGTLFVSRVTYYTAEHLVSPTLCQFIPFPTRTDNLQVWDIYI
jgi:hypothetical protein